MVTMFTILFHNFKFYNVGNYSSIPRKVILYMIDYTPLWNTMKEKDISQYDLLNHGIDKRTLQRLRTDQNITALTIEKLCQILHCTPNDIIRFISEEEK